MKINNLMSFAGGILIGFGAAYVALENRFGREYTEMANANRRAYEKAALFREAESPEDEIDFNEVATSESSWADHVGDTVREIKEMKAHSVSLIEGPNVFGEVVKVVPEELTAESVKNDYARAVEATETSHEDFVAGTPNVYGMSYIEEEDYEDENGYEKYHVDLLMDETNPIFLLDGQPMDDWAERIGDSILLDMFKLCPPGVPPVLYVRNLRDAADYEVARVET